MTPRPRVIEITPAPVTHTVPDTVAVTHTVPDTVAALVDLLDLAGDTDTVSFFVQDPDGRRYAIAEVVFMRGHVVLCSGEEIE